MKSTIWLAFLLVACGGDGTVPSKQVHAPSASELITGNKEAVKLEDRDIDLYVQRHALTVQPTGTGVRFGTLRDMDGPTVGPEQWAQVNYRMELLTGDTAYASEPGKPESFLVEHDDVESGLHEAVQRMSPGDSAIIIIPSYRAHGLIGDMDKVPMRSTIVYHIGLVSVLDDGTK